MTWVGKDYNINLFAETFTNTEEGVKKGNACELGFPNPKCHGMEHLDSRDHEALGETIRVDANLFYHPETKELLKDKRVLVYIVETSPSKKEVSNSNAVIELFMPE